MKYLFFIASILLLNLNPVYAAVTYDSAPPVEREVNKKKQRVKKRFLKKKRKPNRENSPRIGKVYLIIGIAIVAACLITSLILFLIIKSVLALLLAIPFFIGGLFCIIIGLRLIGRNKNWDADYR